MRTFPSELAVEAAGALKALLDGRVSRPFTAEFFAEDWSDLWTEIREGGWVAMGEEFREVGGAEDALLDLAFVAEEWGRHLIPLPFSEACILGTVQGQFSAIGLSGGTDRVWLGFSERFGLTSEALRVDTFAPSRVINEYPLDTARIAVDESGALATMLAGEAVGCAAAALELSIDYSANREAYGRPIGAFQAVKHLAADMHRDLVLARSCTTWAAQDPASRWKAIPEALLRCRRVVAGAIQIHGGMGFTWEVGLHFYFRHIQVIEKSVTRAIAGRRRRGAGTNASSLRSVDPVRGH